MSIKFAIFILLVGLSLVLAGCAATAPVPQSTPIPPLIQDSGTGYGRTEVFAFATLGRFCYNFEVNSDNFYELKLWRVREGRGVAGRMLEEGFGSFRGNRCIPIVHNLRSQNSSQNSPRQSYLWELATESTGVEYVFTVRAASKAQWEIVGSVRDSR